MPHRPLLAGGERLREEIDLARGGGDKYSPVTVEEARELLTPQITDLRVRAREIPEERRGSRVIFEVRMLPNFLANSYYPEAFVDYGDLAYLGARSSRGVLRLPSGQSEAPSRTLILAGSLDGIERLLDLAEETPRTTSARSAQANLVRLDAISIATPDQIVAAPVDAANRVDRIWEAVLHPEFDAWGRPIGRTGEVIEKWVLYVAGLGGEVDLDHRLSVDGLVFVPIRLADAQANQAALFNPLRALRPMPPLRPVPQLGLRAVALVAPTRAAALPADAPRIAIFDGGIDATAGQFAGVVTQHELTDAPADPLAVRHGSLVTSTLLYGPDAINAEMPPAVRVDHYRVLPVPVRHQGRDVYWLLDQIEQVIQREDYDIVNLSLGPEIAVDGDLAPHPWTVKLDELAYERDVLFVSATGNGGLNDPVAKMNRLQVPSDMVNGVGIGACDSRAPDNWARADYSSVGPGRAGLRTQPLGVSFGGTDANPVSGFGPGGIVNWTGTSFAAPLATRGLSMLATTLPIARRTPNTLRAFAVHFAEPRPAGVSADEAGYGRMPEHFDSVLECSENRVTVLYEDVIERDQALSYPLPLPDAAAGGSVYLSWTLVAGSEVEAIDPTEYARFGIEVVFRPNQFVFSYADPATGRRKLINVSRERRLLGELLRQGVTSFSRHPVSQTLGGIRSEYVLRDHGKWETLQHMPRKGFRRTLHGPRLDLAFLARRGGRLWSGSIEPLRFSLLVTLETPRGTPLYEPVLSQFQVLSDVRTAVRTQVQP